MAAMRAAHYDGVRAIPGTDQTKDLQAIAVATLALHARRRRRARLWSADRPASRRVWMTRIMAGDP